MNKLVLIALLFSFNVMALSVPVLTRPVEDLSNIISEEEKNIIEQEIRQLHKNNGVQMSVLIIPTLDGENLEEYSMKVVEYWKLGSAEEDNGLLLLLVMKERKIRLEVGNGIEGIITDYDAKNIINAMGEDMRSRNYAKAINSVLNSVRKKFYENTSEYKEKQRLEQERMMEEAKNSILILLSAGLVFLFFYFTVNSFIFLKKIKNREKVNLELENEVKTVKDKTDFLCKELKELKIDEVKNKKVVILNSTVELRMKLSSLKNELEKMKKVLK